MEGNRNTATKLIHGSYLWHCSFHSQKVCVCEWVYICCFDLCSFSLLMRHPHMLSQCNFHTYPRLWFGEHCGITFYITGWIMGCSFGCMHWQSPCRNSWTAWKPHSLYRQKKCSQRNPCIIQFLGHSTHIPFHIVLFQIYILSPSNSTFRFSPFRCYPHPESVSDDFMDVCFGAVDA